MKGDALLIMTAKKKARKFRKEKYIKVQQYKDSTYFIVSFQYDTPTGKQTYSKQFNSSDYPTPVEALNAACAHRDKKRAEMAAGTLVGRSNRTVNEIWEDYCRTHPMPETTLQFNEYLFKYFREEYGNRPIQSITPLDITRNLESLKTDRSDQTIGRVVILWRKIIKQAILEGILTKDPLDMVTVPKSTKRVRSRVKTCSEDTVDMMIDELRSREARKPNRKHLFTTIAVLIEVLRNTGMRPGEAYALTTDCIDFPNRTISIDARAGVDEDGDVVIKKAKTETSVRVIPMNDACEKALWEALEIKKDGYLVFSDYNGKPLDTRQVAMIINEVTRETGLKFNLYMLRHNVASKLITSHVDPRTVMEILGHKSAEMTLAVYSRSTAQNRQEAMLLVENGRKMS